MSAGAGGLASEVLARVREFREAVRLLHADPSEVRALADRRLAAVVEAARTVEPYRSLWASLGEIRTVKDLTRLPITERAHLQDAPIESRLTCPPDGLVWQSTSGSTAAFLTTAWSREEDRSIQVQVWRQFMAQGIPLDARRLDIEFRPPREPAELRVGGEVLRVSMPKSPTVAARIIRSEGVEVLMGMPSELLELSDLLGSAPMRGLVTFGEVRSAPDAEALREAYGVRPMDWYASGEIMLIAWECPSGRGYHVNADSVVVEVVDRDGRPPPPGERGEVVVTALNNRTTPIVRYRIGDIGVLLVDPCPCGITLPLMGPIEGRTPDWIVGPGGRRISPFRVVLGVLLGGEVVNTVRRYRITQRAVDDFLVEVVWKSGRREDMVGRLAPALSWVLQWPVRVECRDVPELPGGGSRKFRQVVSLVKRAGGAQSS